MTKNFIPALPRHPLYCVWITTGNARQPLECIWIDPEFRSLQFMDFEQTNGAGTTQGSNAKALSTEQSLVSFRADELPEETRDTVGEVTTRLQNDRCVLGCGCGVAPEARNGSALTFYSHDVLVEALQ